MKKIYALIYCLPLLFCFCGTSQNILIRGIDNGNLPDNFLSTGEYYYKDVHQYLDWFEGTWEYVNGNEKFQIVLTKIINYHTVIPELDFNFYEDAIVLRYRKYVNNQLVFESPLVDGLPFMYSTDGQELSGTIYDYGRLTKTLYKDPFNTEVWRLGGYPMSTRCHITKQPLSTTTIKFSLSFFDAHNYDSQTYAGQPTHSIPDNVIMTKVN